MDTGTKTILHLIETSDLGGAENVMINLATNFEKRGFHSIVCLRNEGMLYNEVVERGVEAYVIEEKGFFDFTFLIKLVMVVRKKKVSLIHAHEFLMNIYGTLAGMMSGTPVVTTLHGKLYYVDKWRRRLALRFVSLLSQLTCVSEDLRCYVSKELKIPNNRIKTIYNGIDTKVRKKDNYALIRSELGIKDSYMIVGTVANLDAIKGHTYLLRAIPSVIQEFPHVVFLFIGKGDQEEKLREEARTLGISEYVRFLGFRSDVPEFLNSLDVFVLPSLSECLPLSVLEAMSFCVPVVVTDVGGNREIIDDGVTGYIVPPADSKALADNISLLLRDRKIAQTVGSRGSEVIDRKFSLQAMLAQYESLYHSLL